MDETRVNQIYDELGKLTVALDLDDDPTPNYIQNKLIECNDCQRRATRLNIEVTKALSHAERYYRVEKLKLEILRRETLTNNTSIKKIPTGKEREAAVDDILEDKHKMILDYQNKVNELTALADSVKEVQREIRGTNSDIKLLVKVMEESVKGLNIGSSEDPEIRNMKKDLAELEKLDEEITVEDVDSSEEYVERDTEKNDIDIDIDIDSGDGDEEQKPEVVEEVIVSNSESNSEDKGAQGDPVRDDSYDEFDRKMGINTSEDAVLSFLLEDSGYPDNGDEDSEESKEDEEIDSADEAGALSDQKDEDESESGSATETQKTSTAASTGEGKQETPEKSVESSKSSDDGIDLSDLGIDLDGIVVSNDSSDATTKPPGVPGQDTAVSEDIIVDSSSTVEVVSQEQPITTPAKVPEPAGVKSGSDEIEEIDIDKILNSLDVPGG